MGATIMQQAVKFAARLDRTTQMADMFADVIERVHNYKEISSIFFK